ncbi:hypothetical protein SMACR_06878 [Sordaria macrospora]|uniref:WGS project CABT00000000 data, contig 2.38 n=2 Tax=Sordaria macrospora TaxID=5147 RepID=F7W789_SORMK|nr:uncharacterized protein SMAC_06878 [Sordaria macrospora k-hell]KAA8633655.1 hypothetical protein SMACR_06878 [Sordaria macrospora]WPJ59597.1 hypothetical protein SMAC4_06878 [Sordaria macrospora]CCC13380.1 unnamed protein product [Sordaria macrospora k-hell]
MLVKDGLWNGLENGRRPVGVLATGHWKWMLEFNALERSPKYRQLGANGDHNDNWHKYYGLSFQKFLADLPKTPEERVEAVQKLVEWNCSLEAAHRGIEMQPVPKNQSPSTKEIVDAVAKKVAECLLAAADKTTTDDAEGRPSKRIKVEGDGATTFNFEVTVEVNTKDKDVAN